MKKILIADGVSEYTQLITSDPKAAHFEIKTVSTGKECLEKLHTFQPDLLIVDFMLPQMHGIEILKAAKTLFPQIGVILTSYHGMVQNYRCAAKLGANYLLDKPYTTEHFFSLVNLFFQGELQINPIAEKKHSVPIPNLPPPSAPKTSSYLKFWGTRGSNPVAGMEYVRFGGNTPALEVRHKNDLIIVDAGSGIRGLGQELAVDPATDLHLFISHTHWDHLLGFPFFIPLYQPKRNIKVYAPVGFEKKTEELFADMLAYAYFPVAFNDIQSHLTFTDLRDSETFSIGDITVATHYAFHPGSTLCFTFQVAGKKIGYVTDNEFLFGCHLLPSEIEKKPELFIPYQSLIEFLKGCDILIHEAQYTPEEYLIKEGWGHSSVYNAAALIKKAEIRRWIVVHHDPKHTDSMLLEKEKLHMHVLEQMGHPCQIQFAYDGMVLPL
jgi:phosphoribosyl 1,2-cyclic phosphodiesterase/ActR/RegA family two-component response regulator